MIAHIWTHFLLIQKLQQSSSEQSFPGGRISFPFPGMMYLTFNLLFHQQCLSCHLFIVFFQHQLWGCGKVIRNVGEGSLQLGLFLGLLRRQSVDYLLESPSVDVDSEKMK